jgi:hypothetical protein
MTLPPSSSYTQQAKNLTYRQALTSRCLDLSLLGSTRPRMRRVSPLPVCLLCHSIRNMAASTRSGRLSRSFPLAILYTLSRVTVTHSPSPVKGGFSLVPRVCQRLVEIWTAVAQVPASTRECGIYLFTPL